MEGLTHTQTQVELVEIKKDIESLTKTMTNLTDAVEKLVNHQYKYELIQQEVSTLRRKIAEYIERDSADAARIWKAIDEQEEKLDKLNIDVNKNSWTTKLVSGIGVLIASGIVTWIVKVVEFNGL